MDGELRFLLCEWCQREVKDPKLLPCFHNFCTECLEGNKAVGLCPICRTPHSQSAWTPKQDNLLFRNLQTKLSIYQKVSEGKDLMCECQREAEFWCLECKEFFCPSCFGLHQRLLKESHQAKSLRDLKAESSKGFFSWIGNLSIISCSKHNNQCLSHYCPECRQPLCSTCALLDSKHTGQHRDLKKEIQQRQEELQGMSMKLKKSPYYDAHESLKTLVTKKEKEMNETKKLIQKMIDAMVQMVQKNGGSLLREVEKQHSQEVQDIKAKMEDMEGVLKRIQSSERLVEKMRLYAFGQEVMDMLPFVRQCLEELQRKRPPTVDYKVQTENLTEVKAQLQALFERVTGEKGAANSSSNYPEEESSDEELLDSLLEDTNDQAESSLTEATTYSFSSPPVLNSGLETLVFFDMKNLPGKMLQLVAVGGNSRSFSVTFQPHPFLDRGDMKTSLCEHGLDNFLHYLQTLHMPILVGFNLWTMDLSTLVNSLEAIKKEERFEASIVGFLDAFPLIKQITPETHSYTLKHLHRTYLSGQLDDTQAEGCARTVMDLCNKLGVSQMMKGERVISYSSLRCYTSLQPLLKEKLLSKTSAQTLALHNVDLSKLQLVYQENPGYGLQRFCQALNSSLKNNETKIRRLSKIRSYFQSLSLANWLYSSAAKN
ncbi:hypothetical protein lerEdw1_008390 [Lerista edwardsae]|nr:hypothetical protein lerEdw1_008390 [Lerista edwardsae]